MSNREDGDQYARKILDMLNLGDYGTLTWTETKASGSVHGDCDLVLRGKEGAYCRVDCKHRSKPTKSVAVTGSELHKAWMQGAADGSIGMIITNIDDPAGSVAVIPINALIGLLSKAFSDEK